MWDIIDPVNNTAYEFHTYLDSDASGTNETCVSNTIGAERYLLELLMMINNQILE